MKMWRAGLVLLLVVLGTVSSGCNGSRETDEVAYTLVLGVDATDDDKLEVTYQMAVPRTVGSQSGPKDIDEATEIISVKAPSIPEARMLAKANIARTINVSHVKGIIIGEKLARKGMYDLLAGLNRFRDYRGSMFVMVVENGTAKKFIESMAPKQEVLPSRYFETILNTSTDSGYYVSSTLHNMYTRMVSGSGAPYATLVAVNSAGLRDRPQKERTTADRAGEYSADAVPRSNTGNPVEFLGVALFSGDKMVGYLNNVETRQMAILQGIYQKGFITVTDPQVPGTVVTLNLREGRKPKLNTVIADGKAVLTADILLEGEITAISSGFNYEDPKNLQQLEQHIAAALEQESREMLSKTQELRSDVVGFGYPARASFATYPEYRQAHWGDMYQNADIQVKVAVKLRRTSLMRKSSPVEYD